MTWEGSCAWPGQDKLAHPFCPCLQALLPPPWVSAPLVPSRCPLFPPGAGPALTHPAAKEELENILPAVSVHEGVVLEHRGGGGLLAVGLRGLLGEVVGPVVLV